MFKRNKAKFAFLGLTALLLAGCGGGGGNKGNRVRLLVWGPAEEKEVYEELAKRFNDKITEDTEFSIIFRDVGEADAATNAKADVTTAADVFIFPDDQLSVLDEAGVLYKLEGQIKEDIIARDSESSVTAATNHKGDLLAFPFSEDNGYFMYYDADYFTEEEANNLNLNAALKSGKLDATHQFMIELGNGYYAVSPFAVRGNISYNPETKVHATDFNNADGLASLNGMVDLFDAYKDKGLRAGNVDESLSDFTNKDGNVVAAVSGSWNDVKIGADANFKVAATKLPTFNVTQGGEVEEVQMGAFIGCKLVGVKSSTKHVTYSLEFAKFITSEEAQQLRYEKIRRLPTNKALMETDLLEGNLSAAGLGAQKEFAISQSASVGGTFWDPMKAVGDYIVDPELRELEPQQMLDNFVTQITKAA